MKFNENIITFGVRPGDRISYFPFNKNKRKIILNHKKIILSSLIKTTNHQYISLPSLGSSENHLKLICHNINQIERYTLESTNEVPFQINGINSIMSFVERGDSILIDYNKLYFEPQKTNIELENNWNIPSEQILNSNMNILLEGETGTGKSTLAKKIHDESNRQGPFIHINLSAFSESLIESELFGHVRGAFTGALKNKTGAFLNANNGTLFLDEIDSVSKEIQTKLLLFLDSKEIRAVGSDTTCTTNCRIIFAGNRNLEAMVKSNLIRKDFYFRLLSGFTLKLNTLRDSPELLSKLCYDYIAKHNLVITSRLINFYKTLPWPGNIRQLNAHLNKKRVLMKGRKLDLDFYDDELIAQSSNLLNIFEGKSRRSYQLNRKHLGNFYKYKNKISESNLLNAH